MLAQGDPSIGTMARYVILYHETPVHSPRASHWDLMVEQRAYLRTWALPEAPVVRGPMPCEALPTHRKIYLDYQGPLSGNRGWVTRWDHGTCTVVSEREDLVTYAVRGVRLAGTMMLRKVGPKGPPWEYTFHGFAGGGSPPRQTRLGRR